MCAVDHRNLTLRRLKTNLAQISSQLRQCQRRCNLSLPHTRMCRGDDQCIRYFSFEGAPLPSIPQGALGDLHYQSGVTNGGGAITEPQRAVRDFRRGRGNSLRRRDISIKIMPIPNRKCCDPHRKPAGELERDGWKQRGTTAVATHASPRTKGRGQAHGLSKQGKRWLERAYARKSPTPGEAE